LNLFIALPLTVRLAMLAIAGALAGSAINAGIYSLAWWPRAISPWQQRDQKAPPRHWSDFLPIVGWLGLVRETPSHGRGFWLRPMLLELACCVGLPSLYYWEICYRLAPPLVGVVAPAVLSLHHQFFTHAILIGLMLVATFIDFDEKTIPDEITVTGTILGLLLAAAWPDSNLPVARPVGPAALPIFAYEPLLLTSTSHWPSWFNKTCGLALGIAIFIAWCVALIPALATLRRGWWNGIRYYFASMCRGSAWWKMLVLALPGSIFIGCVWRADDRWWQALLSSLVGLAFGGGLVWAVRIVGRFALHKEAMGFGDVTLMAMIGAFLGWQPCLMIFFVSPFAALIIALAQVALTGKRDIPYGPYLCAAALVVILQWPWFWTKFGVAFGLGWLLPAIVVICLVLLMALLTLWRLIERAFFS
jgi:prepilin signal peptidase PulO-like enzyme (type II secretory pathway)